MEYFSLNTRLIPTLKTLGIKYRYIDGVYDPMTIIVKYKNFDVCRIDAITDSKLRFSYAVYWFSIVDPFFSLTDTYRDSYDLCNDIIKAFKIIEKGCLGKKEDKMNNKMYTVKPLRSLGIGLADCDRIKEAIDCKADVISTDRLVRMFGKTSIKDVIFNNPATIVLWEDGTKTVVKAENEPFDPEKGLAMAVAKKALGNNYDYYDIFKKYVGRYEKKQKKGEK